jgi:hypothetical protein
MRVIGAGFGRTGTASTKRALEILGFGPCHHMEEVIKHPDEVDTWVRAARGEKVDWKAFMSKWGSAVDFPSSLYYRELMEAFPDGKVVLNVRSVDSWYQSMSETIVPMLTRWPNRMITPWLPYISSPGRVMRETKLRETVLDRFHSDPAAVKKVFTDHIEDVKRAVPAEKLLVFEAKDGWEPLCKFLGVPVPEVPFPRVNDTAEFKRRVVAATVISWVILLFGVSLALTVLRLILGMI